MEKKYKVGYTTGVFDLFHVGHLNILRRAKEQCEYLIVGVSTDDLVMEYKGKKPVISFESRVAILEAIKYVDKVVAQTTMDKVDAWKSLKFEAMFHGNDWKDSPLFNKYQEEFNKLGVDLIFFPYTEGVSSSIIKTKIKK